MNLRQNINKIHIDLSNKFEETKITEKSNKELGNFFEIECVSENKRLVATISKKNLDLNVFSWNYLSNPDDKKSIVERTSNVITFVDDVNDIFTKNRFDSDYIKKIS